MRMGKQVYYALAAVLLLTLGAARPLGKVIFEKNSRYHQIYVYQNGSTFSLVFGKQKGPTVQSQIDLRDRHRHLLEYSTLTYCGLLYKPEPKRILIVGLGGGMLPMDIRHYFPKTHVDVVEIDPDVAAVAREVFGLEEGDGLKVHIRDGRVFVRELARQEKPAKYDIIILDAFNSDYIPFHLMTREFLEQAGAVLQEDGVVVANVFHTNKLFDAELATYLTVFKKVQPGSGSASGNTLSVALGPAAEMLTPQDAYKKAEELQEKHKFMFDLRQVARRLRPNPQPGRGAFVLTDDRAPVNVLRSQERDAKPDAKTHATK